ncbi:MAG: hypothetical protein IKK33_04010 [Lachnospiraceae bacterium]|nr:hypothetical protein [Lachnospiraceae bacterium]
MRYDRKIKYLELVEQGVSLQNAGFVKLEIRDTQISLQINADRLPTTDDGNVQILLVSEEREAVLGEMYIEQGKGSVVFEAFDGKDFVDGIGYDDLQKIKILLKDARYLCCNIKEKVEIKEGVEKEPKVKEALQIKPELEATDTPRQEPELGAIVLEVPPLDEKEKPMLALQMPREEYKEQAEERHEAYPAKVLASTKWQQLWEMYPHIRPFEDRREYLKLKPEDLVVLSSECYSLVSNSFLLHGFYNYQHLILTKEFVRGQEQHYIGAPGNFYAKEKQVAILFGFESFEGKAEPAKNGDFGYYMIPVEI